MKKNLSCCSTGASCCSDSNPPAKRELVIDFLYLDLTVCDRCQSTDASLDAALQDVSKVLEATGVKVIVNKVNVATEALAQQYEFVSSPTIRINGQDIQMNLLESECEACGDLCGDSVDCRIWVHEGEEYTAPPKALIIEALLKHVYGSPTLGVRPTPYVMPENLKRFYAKKNKK